MKGTRQIFATLAELIPTPLAETGHFKANETMTK
jgi:hypothetical protein